MWQKDGRSYHYILNGAEVMPDGRTAISACDHMLEINHKKQSVYPMEKRCGTCAGVARLVNGSLDDARYFLKEEKRAFVLQRALKITTSVTLQKIIQARIRRLEKAGA